MSYTVEERGTPNTLSYRAFIKDSSGKVISPMHDIPLWANEEKTIVNMVCEVSRWTNAKMEINLSEPMNPIKQDEKKGKARFVHNCFPHHGYIWNYGAIPQTWENPDFTDEHTQCKGDGDPIDICDISEIPSKIGEIRQIKVLGVMAMIDDGETDWKVIGIDVNSPLAAELNDVGDIDRVMPGQLAATHEWFKIYKIPAGKPENTFAFGGECKDKAFALKIIEETAGQWKTLMSGEGHKSVCRQNTTLSDASSVSADEAAAFVAKEPALSEAEPLDPSVHKWHYIKL